MSAQFEILAKSIRACTLCKGLPLGPLPIFQGSGKSKILIASQAPGRIAHEKGIPFLDPSGRRLRDWMGLSEAQFYNPDIVAIMPTGFCFPGTGPSGDLPPRPECAPQWHDKMLALMPNIRLTLVIGQFAMARHFPGSPRQSLTARVADYKAYLPDRMPLPHPSPRNNRWLKKTPWFEADVLPALKSRITSALID